MNKIKPLSIEETALKEEMKNRCFNQFQYIDEKAKQKFDMLCHLENFEIAYHDLQQRIDKAIEMIKKCTEKELNYITYKGEEHLVCGSDFGEGADIIEDILKGEENE